MDKATRENPNSEKDKDIIFGIYGFIAIIAILVIVQILKGDTAFLRRE